MTGAEIQATWFLTTTAVAVVVGGLLIAFLNVISTESDKSIK